MIRREKFFHSIQHSYFCNALIRYKHGEFRTHFLKPLGYMIFQRFSILPEQLTLLPSIYPARHLKFSCSCR